jgi:hypothetical protein
MCVAKARSPLHRHLIQMAKSRRERRQRREDRLEDSRQKQTKWERMQAPSPVTESNITIGHLPDEIVIEIFEHALEVRSKTARYSLYCSTCCDNAWMDVDSIKLRFALRSVNRRFRRLFSCHWLQQYELLTEHSVFVCLPPWLDGVTINRLL